MIYLRALQLALSFAGVIAWIALAVRFPRKWGYTVPPLLWLIDVFLFNLAATCNAAGICSFSIEFLNIWSASTRIFALLLLVGGGAILLAEGEGEDYFDRLD